MLRYAYTLLIVAFFALQAQAASYLWNGSVSTNWANANNWTPAGVPGSGDNVSISTATNQPTLDTTRSIADLTLNSGSQLNLAGFTLTITGNAVFTSATTVNGKLLCSAFTASNSQFDTELSITTTAFSTNGCTYNEPFLVNYSGSTGSNNGGNIFHSIAHINQSGSMPLNFGMANPDVFHDSLFAQVSGSREISFGTNTSGTQFKGYCRFTRGTGAGGNGVLVGNASHGALFEGNVEIASTSSSGLLSTPSMRFQHCVFDTSAQLSIHTSGFSRGQLDLMNCTFNTAVSLTLSGVSSLLIRGGTQFIDNVNIAAPSVFLQQLVAQQSAEFTKTGSGIDQSVGPISASGTFTLNNTGSGSFYVEGDYGDQFNHVVLNNSHAAGVLAIARRGTSTIVSGSLTVNSTAGVVGIGTSATATAINIAGIVNANASGGAVLLNHVQLPSSASLVVGSLASTLQLQNLQYACSTPFTVNQSSGAGRLVLKPGCVFNTKAILTVPRIQIEGSTFNDSLVVNCMVAGISSSGGFTANGPVVFNAHHSSGNWELNYTGGTAIYHGDVYINRYGSGTITFGYAGAHDFYGNLYFNGTQATSDGNNNHFNFKGNTNQSIASTNTHQLGFLRLGVNKPGGALSIEAKVNVLVNLSLTKGNIQVQPTANFGLSTSATVSGGSDSSYVEGFMSKQGTAAFTFPTGGNGSYAPLGIDAVASTCTFKAQYIAEDPDSLYPRSQKDTTLGFINRCGYWNLDRTAGTQNTKVTLGWSNNPCFAPNPADAKVARWINNNWNGLQTLTYTGNESQGSVSCTESIASNQEIYNISAPCSYAVEFLEESEQLIFNYNQKIQLSSDDAWRYVFRINETTIQDSSLNSVELLVDGQIDSIQVIATDHNYCNAESVIYPSIIGDSLLIAEVNELFEGNYTVFAGDSLYNSNLIDSVTIVGVSSYIGHQGGFKFIDSLSSNAVTHSNYRDKIATLRRELKNINGKIVNSGVLNAGINDCRSISLSDLFISANVDGTIILKFDDAIELDSTFNVFNYSDENNEIIIYAQNKITIDGMLSEKFVLISDTIVLNSNKLNSSVQNLEIIALKNVFFNSANAEIIITGTARILQSVCPNYILTCERIGNGNRFDVASNYTPNMTPSEFNNSVVCGWSGYGAGDANLVGNITNNSNNAVNFWAFRNGFPAEGIQSNPSQNPIDIVPGSAARISLRYRLNLQNQNGTLIPNAVAQLDRLFVLLASSDVITPQGGFQYTINGNTFTGLPFDNANYTSNTVGNLTYINCNSPFCQTESYVLIELSDNDIASNQASQLTNISNTVFQNFTRTFTIDPNQLNNSNVVFNRLLLFPRNAVSNRPNASYCHVDDISINSCCPSIHQLTGFTGSSTISAPLVQNNVLNTNNISPTTFFKIENVLNINGSFTIQDSEVILADNATILVPSGSELKIINSTLRGCKTLWESITVVPGGILSIENSTIQDAFESIRGSNVMPAGNVSSFISIFNSQFVDNHTSVHLRGNRNVPNGNFPFNIEGTTIRSSGQDMLPISETEWRNTLLGTAVQNVIRPYTGIRLSGVRKMVSIGSSTTSSNSILDCFTGIWADSSTIRVINNTFNNNGVIPPQNATYAGLHANFQAQGFVPGSFGCAILFNNPATSTVQTRSATIGTFPSIAGQFGLPNGNVITNSLNGVMLTGVRVTSLIIANRFEIIRNDGIIATRYNNSNASCWDNQLFNIRRNGFELIENYRSNFEIRGNRVQNNFPLSTNAPIRGFRIENATTPNSSYFVIDNEANSCNVGFDLNGCQSIDNLQYDDEGSRLFIFDHNVSRIRHLANNTGIRIRRVNKGYFTQNTGMSELNNPNLGIVNLGFDAESSGGSHYICNTSADLNTGFNFGVGNGTTTFAGNRMDNLQIGFQLFNTGVGIGNQGVGSVLHLNSWLPPAAPSPFVAHLRAFDSDGLDTRFNLSQTCNTQTTVFNPANFISDQVFGGISMPVGVPAFPCSNYVYFNTNDNSATRPTDCFRHGGFAEPGSYMPIAESSAKEQYLHRLAMLFEPDTLGLPYISTEMKMEARQLYADLREDSSTNLSSILIEFKDSLAYTADGIVKSIQKVISNIDSNVDSLFTYTELSNKISDIDSILSISLALPSIDPIIKREKLIYGWLLSQKRSETVVQRDYINTVLGSSNVDSMHVVFVNDPKNYVSPSPTMLDSIFAVANSCPYEWGEIVYTCRALNARYDTLAYTVNPCEYKQSGSSARFGQWDESETISNTNASVIYPNPFTNQINYSCSAADSFGKMRFELFDITGRLLFTEYKDAVNGQYTILTHQLPVGVFYLRLYGENQLVKSFKMIKL